MLNQEHMDALKQAFTKPPIPNEALIKAQAEHQKWRKNEAFTTFFINLETK